MRYCILLLFWWPLSGIAQHIQCAEVVVMDGYFFSLADSDAVKYRPMPGELEPDHYFISTGQLSRMSLPEYISRLDAGEDSVLYVTGDLPIGFNLFERAPSDCREHIKRCIRISPFRKGQPASRSGFSSYNAFVTYAKVSWLRVHVKAGNRQPTVGAGGVRSTSWNVEREMDVYLPLEVLDKRCGIKVKEGKIVE